MKAIVHDAYGPPDVLALRDVERPSAGDAEVLIRVRAAGVDRGVWHVMAGRPYLIRLMGYGLRAPRQRVPGMDLAGTVEAIGRNVRRFTPGDEVFGMCEGSFAEYACAREDSLEPKPAGLTFEQAAAVPVSGITALQVVRDAAGVHPGQQVLVIGASGGVGTFAVQIAKAFGAEVTGVCSTQKLDLVRSIGADHVIDYQREEFTDGRRRWDAILDTAGNRPLADLRRALTPRGTLVIVGGEEGGRWLGGLERQLWAALLSPFVSQRLLSQFPAKRPGDLARLRELIEAGQVRPVVDRTWPLGEAPEAVRYMTEGKARGKVVLTV